jgi:3-dehydroquinate synthase
MKFLITLQETKKIYVCFEEVKFIKKVLDKEKIEYSKLIMVTHEKLWSMYKQMFNNQVDEKEIIFVPEGEKCKSLFWLQFLYKKFLQHKLDRRGLVVSLGGGVVGDLVGFASATYMRGVRYLQMPTTLLAMVDASVGGKTAVNLSCGKNLVGSFYQPVMIIIDLNFLKTLPKKEIRNAFGEILKYAIINKEIYDLLIKTDVEKICSYPFPVNKFTQKLIYLGVKTKLDVVKQDEKETKGVREILNLGHTIAHAIETVTNYKSYSHGEAVILGLVAESYIAKKMGLLEEKEFYKIKTVIEKFVDVKNINPKILEIKPEDIAELVKFDKKTLQQKVYRFALPKKIGVVKLVENIRHNLVVDSIKFLQQWMSEKIGF